MSFSAISDSMKQDLLPASPATIRKTFGQVAALCHDTIGKAALQAVSLYRKPRHSNDASIIATEYGHGADQAYRHFYQTAIHGKTVNVTGTSLTDIVNGKKQTVYERSGYRADQYCYNMLVGNDAGYDDPDYIVQMVFRTDAKFASPLHEADIRKLPQIINHVGISRLDFSMCHSDPEIHDADMAASMRQALVLFWDMSGYKQMVRMHGVQQAQHFVQNMRGELFHDFRQNYACDMLRSEGDGVWMAYPVTGFSDDELTDFTGLFLQSSDELLNRYDTIRRASELDAVRRSFSKIALMKVSAMDIVGQESRFAPSVVESDAFLRGRLLMNKAPRDRDVIMVDPALQSGIAQADSRFLSRSDVIVPLLDMPF